VGAANSLSGVKKIRMVTTITRIAQITRVSRISLLRALLNGNGAGYLPIRKCRRRKNPRPNPMFMNCTPSLLG